MPSTSNSISIFFFILCYYFFQPDYITPPCSRVLAPEVMFYGIGKDFGFTLAVLLCLLLGSEYYGFRSVDLVDAVDDCIKPFHLLELFGIVVEQV